MNLPKESSRPCSVEIPLASLGPASTEVWRQFAYSLRETLSSVEVVVVSGSFHPAGGIVSNLSVSPSCKRDDHVTVCLEIRLPDARQPCGRHRNGDWRVHRDDSIELPSGHVLSIVWPAGSRDFGTATILCPKDSRIVRLLDLAQSSLLLGTQLKLYKALVRCEAVLLKIEVDAQVQIREAHLNEPENPAYRFLEEYAEQLYNATVNAALSEVYASAEFAQILDLLAVIAKENASWLWIEITGKTVPNDTIRSIEAHIHHLKERWHYRYWRLQRDQLTGLQRNPLADLTGQAIYPAAQPTTELNALTNSVSPSSSTDMLNRGIDRALLNSFVDVEQSRKTALSTRRKEIIKLYKRSHPDSVNKQIWSAAGIDEAEFYRWRRGEHVSNNVLEKLARVFDLSIENLITCQDDRK
jgi:hypothetical protein